MKAKIKILIVEDEIIIANDLKQILGTKDFSICGIAASYDEAITMFCVGRPQIIICDIYLKGEKTGIDFANKINQLNNIPFVFITAFSGQELLSKINDKSHATYITKPFTNSQVLAAIDLAKYRISPIHFFPEMTVKQEQIALLMKEGIVANKAIASRLDITVNTVKSHKKSMFKIFEVNSSAALIEAIRNR